MVVQFKIWEIVWANVECEIPWKPYSMDHIIHDIARKQDASLEMLNQIEIVHLAT